MEKDIDQAFEKKLKAKHPTLYKLIGLGRVKGESYWGIQIYGFECSAGWYPIIEELSEKIQLELDKLEDVSEFYVVQIKEKFGGLRYYMHETNDAINALIKEAEIKAEKTCERCSEPGTIENIGNWLNCFCNKCKEDRKQEIKKRWEDYYARSKENKATPKED